MEGETLPPAARVAVDGLSINLDASGVSLECIQCSAVGLCGGLCIDSVQLARIFISLQVYYLAL